MRLIYLIMLVQHILCYGQEKNDIQSIRDRYYRITASSVKLEKLSLDKTEFYFEKKKLSIVKKDSDQGKYEYYFDFADEAYHPYFIYFEPTDKSENQLRAYYNEKTELILLKEGNEEKTFDLYGQNPFRYLKQDAYNSINLLFNHFVLTQNPNDERINKILSKVEIINESIVAIDTIEFNKDDSGVFGKLRYLDRNQTKIKTSSFSWGEHFSHTDNDYFFDRKLIYRTSESESWLGFWSSISSTISFYENNKVFRTDKFIRESTGRAFIRSNDNYFLEWANKHIENCVPLITYLK